MGTPLRVLIVEDSEDDAALLLRELHRGGYEVAYERVDSPEAMESATNSSEWDIVICDYSMPKFSGMDALRLQRSKNSDVPFIFLSGTIGEETAVAALKEGAQDYLMKNNLKRLLPAIHREVHEAEQRRERKRLEQQIHNLQKFEAIGRLAGGIAHDFNNALGVILGWAELGLNQVPEESPAYDKFKTIRDQAERTAKLTSQLLAFARHQALCRQSINLNGAIAETLRLLRSVIGEQVEFMVKFEPSLPIVQVDPAQLEQVLLNLCLNARDAMPHGGQIVIETRETEIVQSADEPADRIYGNPQPGRYVTLSVTDSGIGMEAATLDHIFEPFFTTKEMGRGTGLGLATVYGIVQQHNGFVGVRSEPGDGATFSVYLPLAVEVSEASETVVVDSRGQRGTETLLVAEDHDLLRQLTYDALRSQGYNVILANDGYEAANLFEQNSARVDLVILDFMMPGMSGAEALARMRAIRPDLPAIFMTGHIVPESFVEPEIAKGVNLLQKPCRPEVLGRMIRQTLDQRSAL